MFFSFRFSLNFMSPPDITQFYELRDSMVLGRGNSGAVIVCVHLEVGVFIAGDVCVNYFVLRPALNML